MAKVCDFGFSSTTALEGDMGRSYGAYRMYGEAWASFNQKFPVSGNAFASDAKHALTNSTRLLLSLKTATTVDTGEDSWQGNGPVASGKSLLPPTAGGGRRNPATLLTPATNNREAEIDSTADRLANYVSQGGKVDFGGWDHEIDQRCSENPNHGNKGPMIDHPAAVAHCIYRAKQRWLTTLSTGTAAQKQTYARLTGTQLAPDGFPYFRWTINYSFAGINRGFAYPDSVDDGTYNLSTYLDYLSFDIYSETASRGFTTGNNALTFAQDFGGHYAAQAPNRTQAQTEATSAEALCSLMNMNYGIWEAGCIRGTGSGGNRNARFQDQADYQTAAGSFMVGQGTSKPHCLVYTYFYNSDQDWRFPYPSNGGSTTGTNPFNGNDTSGNTTTVWANMNSQSRAMWVAAKGMADMDYFGGTLVTGSAPTLASPAFNISTGAVGATVILTGTNFNNPNVTSVQFHGTPASFLITSATVITTAVPSGATDGTVTVTNARGTATSDSTFNVLAAPTITSITPASGYPGQTVVIAGTQFNGVSSVTLAGTSIPFTRVSGTEIDFTIPAGSVDGNIVITANGGTVTSASPFDVTPVPGNAPRIDDVAPLNPLRGTGVTVTGQYFTGATAVTAGGTAVTSFSVNSDTQITFTTDVNTVSGLITVTNATGTGTSTQSIAIVEPHIQAIYRDPLVKYRDSTVTYRGKIIPASQNLTPVAIGAIEVVFTPALASSLIPDTIQPNTTVYTPTVATTTTQFMLAITNARTLFQFTLTLGAISVTSPTSIGPGTTVYAPQVFTSNAVRPNLLADTVTVFTPALLAALRIPTIQNFTLFFNGPSITQTVPQTLSSPTVITNSPVLYTPGVFGSAFVIPTQLTNPSTVFVPSVKLAFSVPKITRVNVLFTPGLTQVTPQSILANLLVNTRTLFQFGLIQTIPQTVSSPNVIINTRTVFTPAVPQTSRVFPTTIVNTPVVNELLNVTLGLGTTVTVAPENRWVRRKAQDSRLGIDTWRPPRKR